MELENIQLKTTWSDAAGSINSNNLKISTEVAKLQEATYKNKGYFKTVSDLTSTYPTASLGSKAYVGNSYPYAIYLWEGEEWVNSGSTGGEESVELGNYYTKAETDEQLTELESEVKKIEMSFIDGALIRFGGDILGKTINIESLKESNAAFKYAVVKVSKGDLIELNVSSTMTVGVWCLLDENNVVVRANSSGAASENAQIEVKEAETTLLINCRIQYEGISYITKAVSLGLRIETLENGIGLPTDIAMVKGLIRFGKAPQGNIPINNVEIVGEYQHSIIKVNAGDVIEINAYAAATVGTWCTIDSNNNAIRFGSGMVSRIITIQEGEDRIVINNIGAENISRYISKGTLTAQIKNIGTPNVVYVAAFNSPTEVKKNCNFVCTGVSDQKIINSAIASLEYGGIIHLCAGNYVIDSFNEVAAIAWNCAIGMNDNGKSRHIVIEGDYLPIVPNENSLRTEINVSDECYNAIGENAVAVIGTSYSVAEYGYYYRNALSVKNIAIVLPSNTKPVIGVLQIHTSIGGCDNVQVLNKVTGDFVNAGEQGHAPTPHSKSVGFYGHPTANSNPYNIYNNCLAQGCGVGFEIGGDHNVLINCWAGRNSIGYSFGVVSECSHHNTLINCCSESDTQFMRLGGRTASTIEPLSIINFQIEKNPELAPLGDDLCCTEVNPNTQWCGEITYSAAPLNTPFFEDGQGRLFKVRNLRHKLAGRYLDAPINPSYLQLYYDDELDRMLIHNGKTWKEL